MQRMNLKKCSSSVFRASFWLYHKHWFYFSCINVDSVVTGVEKPWSLKWQICCWLASNKLWASLFKGVYVEASFGCNRLLVATNNCFRRLPFELSLTEIPRVAMPDTNNEVLWNSFRYALGKELAQNLLSNLISIRPSKKTCFRCAIASYFNAQGVLGDMLAMTSFVSALLQMANAI